MTNNPPPHQHPHQPPPPTDGGPPAETVDLFPDPLTPEPAAQQPPVPVPSGYLSRSQSSASQTRRPSAPELSVDPPPAASPPTAPTRSRPSTSPVRERRADDDDAPRPRRKRNWWVLAGVAAGVVAGGTAAGVFLLPRLGLFQAKRPDLITHVVQNESLPVTVVERGTLESANNQELVCKVKAGARGTFASSIKRVIDDGTQVTKGQLVLELDDSALKDQEQTQNIAVSKANAAYIKAKEELEIQRKVNASDITTKEAALEVAQIDLEKFLGISGNPERDPVAAVAGGLSGLEEKGEFRMKVDDLSAQLKLAKSDLEAYKDRSAWVERAARSGYQTPSQVGVEVAKFDSARDKVEKLAKEKYALETYTRKRELTDLLSKVKVAIAGVEQAVLQANAKENQASIERDTTYSVYVQELSKLDEIQQQLAACKLYAPQSGMVVYYKDQNSRFSSNNEGMIQVGAQVKEGQKLLRIPDLSRMQVNTKIHEALVSRIKGDDRRPTGVYEALRAGLLVNPDGFSRLFSQSEFTLEVARDLVKDKEYYVARPGQTALIKVDAFASRLFTGRVRSVAAVAAQADWNSSDVKLFPTIVSIEDTDVTGLKPDYSAEVTIQVDPGETKVLTVPLQAVVGTSDMGPTRKVYVLENGLPTEREVELGIFNEKKVEVKSGVKEGEVVVINPKAILGDKARGVREEGDPSGRGAGKAPGAGGGRPGGGQGGPGAGKPGGGQGGPGAGGTPQGGNPGAGGPGGGKGPGGGGGRPAGPPQ